LDYNKKSNNAEIELELESKKTKKKVYVLLLIYQISIISIFFSFIFYSKSGTLEEKSALVEVQNKRKKIRGSSLMVNSIPIKK